MIHIRVRELERYSMRQICGIVGSILVGAALLALVEILCAGFGG